jgi:hypothetical protein
MTEKEKELYEKWKRGVLNKPLRRAGKVGEGRGRAGGVQKPTEKAVVVECKPEGGEQVASADQVAEPCGEDDSCA